MLFVFLSWWCKHLNSFSGDFIRVSSPCSIPKITCWYNWLIQLAISPYQESPEKKSSMGFPNDIFTMRNIKTLLKQTHSYPNSSWVYWVYTSNGILSWVTMKSPWSHHEVTIGFPHPKVLSPLDHGGVQSVWLSQWSSTTYNHLTYIILTIITYYNS